MATNESTLFCDVCRNRDLNKSAEEYCPQCEEALCRECRDHHKISRSSKSHQTISVEKYRKLPSFIKQIKHYCAEHDCFLEFFCKSHDCLCCKLCLISGHKVCKETIFIEEFLTSSSGHHSAALDNIEKVLKDLKINICSVIKDRNRNLTELREQKRVITEQIKEKRQEINTLLDQLEGVLLEKASAMENEYCRKIEEVITKLEDVKERVDEIQNDVKSVKMCASNLQMFMGTTAFQESVSINEINVQKLHNNGSLNNVTIECMFNNKIDGVIKEIKTFGDIKVNNCNKHVLFSWKGDNSAQIFKPVSGAKSFGEIIVKLVRRINIGRNCVTGCAMSEAGNMLFVQAYNGKLLKYESNGQFHSELCIIPGKNVGYDLAVVDSHLVAVSSGEYNPKHIHLFDMNNAKLQKKFNLQDLCYGLSYHNGLFICCTDNNGIKLYDTLSQKLNNMQILPNAPKDVSQTYVTSNEKGIFHSHWRDNSVVCYDFSGQVQWTYSDSLLRKPYGITLDSYSNIYVAGAETNNIVVISPDGNQAKELLELMKGLLVPVLFILIKSKTYF